MPPPGAVPALPNAARQFVDAAVVSSQPALALAALPEIALAEGKRVPLHRLAARLQALGAGVIQAALTRRARRVRPARH